jgi:hypothetical protein
MHKCLLCRKCKKCHTCHKKKKIESRIVHLNNDEINPHAISNISILDMCNIYGLNKIILNPKKKISIAISIVGTYPNWKSDLIKYCSFYNITQQYIKNIKIVQLNKNTPYIEGWAEECALDLQTVYTVISFLKCDNVTIHIIQARSNSYPDLMDTIVYANKNNIQVVSMSWGSNEFSGIMKYNSYFNNSKCCYFASTGDSVNPSYPASCSNVCAIGGTELNVQNSQRINESVWNGAGCSSSKFIQKPSYQNNVKNIPNILRFRVIPDVVSNASPKSGITIFFNNRQINGIGGTSLSCPFNASIFACFMTEITNLTTVQINNPKIQLQFILYNLSKSLGYSTYFYDVIDGQSGMTNATKHFDFASGLGVIKFHELLTFLKK